MQSFTIPGALPSEVFSAASAQLAELRKNLPPGYTINVSSEQAKQEQGNSARIGGLGVATFITLLLVPERYSIFVLDLKIVKWEVLKESNKTEPSWAPVSKE